MKTSKEQFRKLALSAIDSVMAVSDDIWEQSNVTVILKDTENYEIVVGIRDAEEPEVPA